jgi:hypothetical protein
MRHNELIYAIVCISTLYVAHWFHAFCFADQFNDIFLAPPIFFVGCNLLCDFFTLHSIFYNALNTPRTVFFSVRIFDQAKPGIRFPSANYWRGGLLN